MKKKKNDIFISRNKNLNRSNSPVKFVQHFFSLNALVMSTVYEIVNFVSLAGKERKCSSGRKLNEKHKEIG